MLGNRLKKYREENNLTIIVMSEQLNIPVELYTEIEKNLTEPDEDLKQQILKLLSKDKIKSFKSITDLSSSLHNKFNPIGSMGAINLALKFSEINKQFKNPLADIIRGLTTSNFSSPLANQLNPLEGSIGGIANSFKASIALQSSITNSLALTGIGLITLAK